MTDAVLRIDGRKARRRDRPSSLAQCDKDSRRPLYNYNQRDTEAALNVTRSKK